MRIALIGSGISALGAAYLLHNHHDIVVYEKESYIGGHSRTLDIKTPQETVAVDTGFIVFNRRNYPHLTALFSHLDVPIKKSVMSFGVSIDGGWLEYGTGNLPALLAQKRNILRPHFYRMIWDIVRFNARAKAYGAAHPDAVLEQCLRDLHMGDWFKRYYLLAMGGAIWSSPAGAMGDFPAQTFIRFFDNHGLLTINRQPQWYTVDGGSREYVARLTAPFRDKIRLNCKVTKVRREPSHIMVRDIAGHVEHYDHVIFACHSDQALALIVDPSDEESSILGRIKYRKNRAVVHSDINFMPKRKKAWSSWVYLRKNRDDGAGGVCLSYWMNNLQSPATDYPIIVTLNPVVMPDPALTHDVHDFEHPIYDPSALDAQCRVDEIQGQDRLWFCGAWQGYGFHEDGLRSAITTVKKFGIEVPWRI